MSGLTAREPLMTRETVAAETPARLATSVIVAMLSESPYRRWFVEDRATSSVAFLRQNV